MADEIVIQQEECESCCGENDILCVSIPCPIDIRLLGIDLQLNLPCLQLTSGTIQLPPIDPGDITPAQLLAILTALLQAIGNVTNLTGGQQ